MQIAAKKLNALASVELSADETTMLKWLRSTAWEPVTGVPTPIPYKTKVPEFYGGVRLYRMQAGGPAGPAGNALEFLIKKLSFQGVISKQELYPLAGHGSARTLSLKKADLDNLGVGQAQEDDEE